MGAWYDGAPTNCDPAAQSVPPILRRHMFSVRRVLQGDWRVYTAVETVSISLLAADLAVQANLPALLSSVSCIARLATSKLSASPALSMMLTGRLLLN